MPPMASALLAASTTAVVWLTVGLVTTVAMIAMLVALIRHVLLIGRAAGRLQDEIAPLRADIDRGKTSATRGGRSPA